MKVKKWLSALLAVIMVISMNASVFAVSSNAEELLSTDDVLIYEVSDGVFKTVKSRNVSNVIKISPDTQFDNIYSTTSQHQYYQKTNDDEFVQVSKIEFRLTDYNAYTDIQAYSIPDEVLEGVASMAAWAEKTNSEDARGVIFITDRNTRSGDLNTYPVTTTTWDGMTFHHYQVYFTDMWTSWQTVAQKGATTESTLTAIKDLAVTGAGMASGSLGVAATIYSAGSTCLNAWKAITNKTPIYGNTNNKVMVDIQYNIYLKYTYYYDPFLQMDRHGCSSQRAYVKRVDTDTYLYTSTGGSRAEETVYPYKTYRTPNYNSPEATAYDFHLSGWVESVQGKVYNKTIQFSFPSFSWPSDWP